MRDDNDNITTEPNYSPDDNFSRRPNYPPEVPPQYPGSVRAAGIIWIILGGLILLSAGLNLLVAFTDQPLVGGAYAAGRGCGVLFMALFGVVFLLVGIQNVNGTAKDTLGNAIGSIIFAALEFGIAVVTIVGTAAIGNLPIGLIVAGIYGFGGMGLLLAGILALLGRRQYLAWRVEVGRARRGPY
jgi:hypothetical protein